MGCHVGLSRFLEKFTLTYFCDFMSANMALGKNFISLILMLVLQVCLWLCVWELHLECLPVWNSSPVAAESFPLLQSVFADLFFWAAYNWHPVILSKLYGNKMYCSVEGEQLLGPCVFSTCCFWNTFFFLMLHWILTEVKAWRLPLSWWVHNLYHIAT